MGNEMKKLFVFIMLAVFLLAACAPAQPVTATPQPAYMVLATASASIATPTIGFVTVKKLQNMQALLLRSLPDPKSAQSGRVSPGETGKILGFNDKGTWAMLQFQDQFGWAPVEVLEFTIAQ
jgi:hypothetical protein